MSSQTRYEIRRADLKNDRGHIIELVSEMQAQDISARYDWIYTNNPHGGALTWLVFDSTSNQAVACTSLFPRKVIIDGQVHIGSVGGDCYVKPVARRRGLATSLHRTSFQEMGSCGVEFMCGPPNENNLDALIKAGSHLVTGFKRWVRPLNGKGLYQCISRRSSDVLGPMACAWPFFVFDRAARAGCAEFYIERLTSFKEEFEILLEEAKRRIPYIFMVRDCKYLNWRYFEIPNRQVPYAIRNKYGGLTGFAALKVNQEDAVLTDLFAVAPDAISAGLQLVIDEATAAGCSRLHTSCTPPGLLGRRLRRFGFFPRESRGFQVAVPREDAKTFFLDREKWHFMEADNDI